MNETKLIIFDCDGVLVDSEAISARILVQELAKIGISIAEQDVFDQFVGRSLVDVAESLKMTAESSIFKKFSNAYHHSLLEELARDLASMPHVHEVIAKLDVAFCVATSSSRQRTLKSLKLSNLDEFFGTNVFTASQVANGKPAPDLFLFAADQMGVAPESCLVIEDSLPGVRAAQAAKMRVWRFTGGSHFAKNSSGVSVACPDIPTFETWEKFFDLDPELKACVT